MHHTYQHVYWTAKDDRILTRMWTRNIPVAKIGLELGRTSAGVYWRVRALELPRRYGEGERISITREDRRKNLAAVALLLPKNGRFDSSRALSFLVDNWKKRAA